MTDTVTVRAASVGGSRPRLRVFAAVLGAAALFPVDRMLFDVIEVASGGLLACAGYPVIDSSCIQHGTGLDPHLATPIGLAGTLLLALILYRHARTSVAAPFVGLLVAGVVLALTIDLVMTRAALAPGILTPIFTALSVLVIVATAGGAALNPTARGLTLAMIFYVLALAVRFASFQLLLALWPMLFDAGRMILLYGPVVLANSFFAVLALVGPSALGRRVGFEAP